MLSAPLPLPPLSAAEKSTIASINSKSWTKKEAVEELQNILQIAVEIELATIPIYLGTYYSINRTEAVKPVDKDKVDFPNTKISRFADEAGGLIMSVAVEEMLHMSLSSNVLFALGKDPLLYGKAPNSYPAYLPHHKKNSAIASNSRNIPIPLAKFSFDQLSHFLAIEYPEQVDAIPESDNWDTIGQVYSYVRCLIHSKFISDADFQVRQDNTNQIQATEYSPNCIDTVYPKDSFNHKQPVAAPMTGSAAKVAGYASDENSHSGSSQLLEITSCKEALEAIATICYQGEGAEHGKYDDDDGNELSHYYKFLTLQSKLNGYTSGYVADGKKLKNNVAPLPVAPSPATNQFSEHDLSCFVYPMPTNGVFSQITAGHKALVDIADGLFQYMLIMTETIYRVPTKSQKIYFNRSMHQSMIWVLDKLLQSMRKVETDGQSLCATFANIDLGTKEEAFSTLTTMVNSFKKKYGKEAWYTTSDLDYFVSMISDLPNVSEYWKSSPPATNPDYLNTPDSPQGEGTNCLIPTPRTKIVNSGDYSGIPQWPTHPPKDDELPSGAIRHACMGLNSCENQGRTSSNDCAGQGYCATALAYNPADPSSPSVQDHTCHVLNDCRGQGGCGLYGTEEELAEPGLNQCQSQGSCATPINAERFITDGELRGQSVWLQARKVFEKKVWPTLRKGNPKLPVTPPEVPGNAKSPNLFQYGPTIGWIENENNGAGMTSCGSSGMSGAGSCA